MVPPHPALTSHLVPVAAAPRFGGIAHHACGALGTLGKFKNLLSLVGFADLRICHWHSFLTRRALKGKALSRASMP